MPSATGWAQEATSVLAPSISTTDLEDSIAGHLIGFCADRAMEEHRVVDVTYESPT